MMARTLVRNGRLIDPSSGVEEVCDVLCVDGKVAQIGPNIEVSDVEIIDATDKVVAPGLIDMHCHLRVPGNPEREDMLTGSKAAAMGGFTTVVPMPNTCPVVDSVESLEYVQRMIAAEAVVNVVPAGAVTLGQRGNEVANLAAMARAGVPIFSDDGQPIANADTMRRALRLAQSVGRAIAVHCEEKSLSSGGSMNAGMLADMLGYPGIPGSSETAMVARDIVLSKETGGHVHVCHVSQEASVDLIRFAKSWGANVTAEVTAHHFTLTEAEVMKSGANAKLSPPLARANDIKAIKDGLRDGTIDVIATDHAPRTAEEKSVDFMAAPIGLVGLETALSLVISELVEPGILTLSEALAKLTVNPSAILVGINKGSIRPGFDADLIVIDLNTAWVADPGQYQSKGKNCPYAGRIMKGKVELVMVGGRTVIRNGRIAA